METDDVSKACQDLMERNVSFRDFLYGFTGRLTSDSFSEASLRSVDLRYTTLKKGTKVYAPKAEEDSHVFALNVKTLSTFLSSDFEEDGKRLRCVSLYQLVEDTSVLEIREDIANDICRMWMKTGTKCKETKNGPEELMATVQQTSDENLQTIEKYQKLLERTNMQSRNLLDYIITPLLSKQMKGILYSRLDRTYSLLVLINTCSSLMEDPLALCQDFVFPQTSLDSLSSDGDGFLSLLASMRSLTDLDDTDTGKQGDMRHRKESQLELQGKSEVIPSYDDHFPTPEEYNDYNYDGNLDYEDLRMDATMETSKSLVSRPGQPPPPPPPQPIAEPVYSIVNKASKKPTPVSRADSRESSGGTGPRPPRPPPLETIPAGEQDCPALISVQQKPSRPVAPPTIRRKITDGNLSQDGKDDILSSPPRGTPKPKARSKSETTKL